MSACVLLKFYSDIFFCIVCAADSSNSVSGGANGEKMGDGCDISVGGWTFLLGRSYCFGGN
jgi:hypothetical protein